MTIDWASIHSQSADIVAEAAITAANYGNADLAQELWFFVGELRNRAEDARADL